MSLGFGPIIVVLVFIALIAVMPTWPHSRRWGYRPSVVLGIIFVLILVFLFVRGSSSF